MKEFNILLSYTKHNIPLDLIARTYRVSLHRVIEIVYYHTVSKPSEIYLSKKLLKDIT